MEYLFDYNPIIEIDEENPIEQINTILKNYDSYIPLIEKNHETVARFHNWNARISQIEGFIAETTPWNCKKTN